MNKRLLAGALALCLLLSGCGGFRDVYEDIFGSEPGQAGEPRSQTSLLLPVDIDDSLSPYAAQSDMNLSITSLLFDPLFVTDNTFAVHPCLAKSINEAGGGEYLVTLRDDVAFSDGTALTAADVVYSFGQTELQQKRYWQLHTSVESVTEVDPHTVRVKAYRSDRNIAGLLDFPIVKNGSGADSLIGTGRYTYQEQSGRRYLTAVAGNPDASGKIPEIELVPMPDDSTLANALRSGVIHCLYTDYAKEADYALGANSYLFELGNVVYIGYSSQNPLTARRPFRTLVSEMVNRDSIISDIYYNKAAPALTPFPAGYYDLPELERSDLGDDRIRMELELMGVTLEESGWRSYEDKPVKLSVLVNAENPFRVRVAETVVRYLGYYGIQAEVETVEYERYLSRLASGDFDLFIAEVCVGDNVDLSPLISGSSVGISGDCSDAQLLEQYYAYCAGTLDCTGFLEQFDRYAPVTPLVYRQGGAVVSPSFHAVMTPVSQDIFYNIKEWQ